MAFGFLKKIGKAIISVPGKVVGLVKKIPKPITDIAIEVLPAPARKVVTVVDKVIPISKLFLKGGDNMNPVETVLRKLVQVVEATRDGIGVEDIGVLVSFLTDTSSAYTAYMAATPDEKVAMLKEALDNMIGTEENALIGPGKPINVDIPIVDDELATDVIIDGAMTYLRQRLAGGGTAGPGTATP